LAAAIIASTRASSKGRPSLAGALSGRNLESAGGGALGSAAGAGLAPHLARHLRGLLAGLPVLVGLVGERAEHRGAAVADRAAGELADRLARLLVAEQQAQHTAGRETAGHAPHAAGHVAVLQPAARLVHHAAGRAGRVGAEELLEKTLGIHGHPLLFLSRGR